MKNHWYDLQLVEGYWNDAMRERVRTLSELQARLGDYHDLTLFQIRLKSMRAKAEKSGDTSILLARAAHSQKKLRARCLLLGHRLFDEAPEHFAQDVSELGPRRKPTDERVRSSFLQLQRISRARRARIGAR